MAQLTHDQYEALERAVTRGSRISVRRRGTEYIVIPRQLKLRGGRESIEAVHPTTGEHLVLFLDEVDRIEVVR